MWLKLCGISSYLNDLVWMWNNCYLQMIITFCSDKIWGVYYAIGKILKSSFQRRSSCFTSTYDQKQVLDFASKQLCVWTLFLLSLAHSRGFESWAWLPNFWIKLNTIQKHIINCCKLNTIWILMSYLSPSHYETLSYKWKIYNFKTIN